MEYVTQTVCGEEGEAQGAEAIAGYASVLGRFIAVIITGTEITSLRLSREKN